MFGPIIAIHTQISDLDDFHITQTQTNVKFMHFKFHSTYCDLRRVTKWLHQKCRGKERESERAYGSIWSTIDIILAYNL